MGCRIAVVYRALGLGEGGRMQESRSEVVTPPTAVASGASTVTFLFTDIEGSTGLWETHPDEMARSLARHDAILRSAVESNGGQVVKTTRDGLFAAFGSAQSAIAGAVAGQGALGQASWESIGPLRCGWGCTPVTRCWSRTTTTAQR
jgi:class 3 adenylate cyclase